MANLCIPTIIESLSMGGDDLSGQLYVNELGNGNEVAVCLAEFARTCTEELLFKEIAKNLKKPCLLFNYTGFGGSCGNHNDLSVVNATKNFIDACSALKRIGFEKIFPIAHSFGAAVLGSYIGLESKPEQFEKIVLLAPALNQALLLRYWFTCSKFPNATINTFNIFFESAGGEEAFARWCKEIKIVKGKMFSEEYWESEKNMDYSQYLVSCNCLWIHGNDDKKVPLTIAKTEGLGRAVFLDNADHDFTGRYDAVTQEINCFFS